MPRPGGQGGGGKPGRGKNPGFYQLFLPVEGCFFSPSKQFPPGGRCPVAGGGKPKGGSMGTRHAQRRGDRARRGSGSTPEPAIRGGARPRGWFSRGGGALTGRGGAGGLGLSPAGKTKTNPIAHGGGKRRGSGATAVHGAGELNAGEHVGKPAGQRGVRGRKSTDKTPARDHPGAVSPRPARAQGGGSPEGPSKEKKGARGSGPLNHNKGLGCEDDGTRRGGRIGKGGSIPPPPPWFRGAPAGP